MIPLSSILPVAITSYKKMMRGGYRITDQGGLHFLTLTVIEWVDVFTRKLYRDTFLDSIRFCQANKGLEIFSWCMMSNHVHLIASTTNNNLSNVLCDLKKFTSREIILAISQNPKESRKEWMLSLFQKHGIDNSRNGGNQFWIQDNHPEVLFTEKFTWQKIYYTHNNPVVAGIVERAEDYLYSSARDYYKGKNVGLLEVKLF